jgi:LssY C-terminus
MIDTARAFIFRDEYLTSPVSPLYVFGRREDVAIQKARSTINERIHARLWLMPYTFQSRRIWIGQVSRDIGVRLTSQTWNLTTHKIGPDVDFDRGYLLQDLLMSGFVERYGFVSGVGSATISDPRSNLTGDPYYTDGLRAVIFLSNQTRPLGEIERLPWELPPAPSNEAR